MLLFRLINTPFPVVHCSSSRYDTIIIIIIIREESYYMII